jgi:hypothetical protein
MITPLVFSAESPTTVSAQQNQRPPSPTRAAPFKISGPTDVFRHAALRASTRRTTVEEPCMCIRCSSKLGTFQLRGTPTSFEAMYVADVKCPTCAGPSVAENETSKRRKRNREVPTLSCEVCKKIAAYGSIKKAVGAMSPVNRSLELLGGVKAESTASATSPVENLSDDVSWTDPDFSVEVICTHCEERYLFCSECKFLNGLSRH